MHTIAHQLQNTSPPHHRDILVVTPTADGNAVDVQYDVSNKKLDMWGQINGIPRVVVATGFIARNPAGQATTLKRNGSDYSATIMGALFQCRNITIWTDVDGVYRYMVADVDKQHLGIKPPPHHIRTSYTPAPCKHPLHLIYTPSPHTHPSPHTQPPHTHPHSADPRKVPEAVCLKHLSYHEAWELSYFGANVLHPRTTLPAMKYSIPIGIKNFFNLDAAGGCGFEEGGGWWVERFVEGLSSVIACVFLQMT